MMPVGCTGWMINDKHHCFLSAGHCHYAAEQQVVQFQVPVSRPDGTVRHPHPDHQYVFDTKSIHVSSPVTEGHDWMYFGVFPNTNTKLAAHEAQGEWFTLSDELGNPPSVNATLEITGYGTTRKPYREKNQVQQYHYGPLVNIKLELPRSDKYPKLWSLKYHVDTSGGNSGSAIVHKETGHAIGIHAYAGCHGVRVPTGANSGMFHGHPSLQQALANPKGVCLNGYN